MQFENVLSFIFLASAVSAVEFEIVNALPGPIWVGILGNSNKPPLAHGGFILEQGKSRSVGSDDKWAGRFWARTWCDSKTKHCQTGDCGNRVECNGAGGTPPVSLAEITLRGAGNQDFYDVSLVDGYNVKVQMIPINGRGNCKAVRCTTEINNLCPKELRQLGGSHQQFTIACFSSCLKFNTDEYCCRGQWNNPNKCRPDHWAVNSASVFKRACPDAYSYAYDDKTSTFTCLANKYKIIFG